MKDRDKIEAQPVPQLVPQQQEEEIWLKPEDLARRVKMSIHTIRHWIKTKKGPTPRKLGGCVRFLLSDVVAWEKSRPAAFVGPTVADRAMSLGRKAARR